MSRKKLRYPAARYLPLFVGIVLAAIAVGAIVHQLQDYSYQDIVNSLRSLPAAQVRQAIACTGLGYLAMTGYDTLGFVHLRQRLAYGKIALTAFITHGSLIFK
ncbi:hypothetical protein [Nodosilinea nodulosa]|uniref:hypothetical protein n=1 Tax=Nodosilinea nodulosa TaxID=416001 RepID=UPI0002E78099|nr:hypothetical protein [Nodosilinea nodulosa]